MTSRSAAAAPVSVQSMTTTKTADVDGTLAQIYALAGRRLRHRAVHVQRGSGGRGTGAHRAALAGAADRRHPLPVQARARGDGSRRAGPAAQSRQHPQARPDQDRRQRGKGPRSADPHRRERREPRPRHRRAVRRRHSRSARRVGAAGARLLRRGRLRRREDLGEVVERAGDDRRVPAAVGDRRHPAAPRRHRSRPAARRAREVDRRDRHAARRGHRRHDPLLAHRRSGRGGEGGPPAARGDGAARAQGSRPHRVPVVRARRGRRDPRRARGAGRARGAQHPAPGGGDGLRGQRSR